MVAYQLEKSLICPSCGTSPWEWDQEQGGDPVAYEAMPIRCEGCARKDMLSDIVAAGKQAGVHLQLLPRAIAEKMSQTRRKRPRSRREMAARERRRQR